jgi:hypothetical protein
LVEAVDASPYVVANSSGGAHRVLAQESLRDAIDNGLAIELRSKSAPDIEITGGKVSFEFGDPVDASYGVIVAPGAKNVSITGVNFHGNNMGAVLAREAAEVNIDGGIDHLGRRWARVTPVGKQAGMSRPLGGQEGFVPDLRSTEPGFDDERKGPAGPRR